MRNKLSTSKHLSSIYTRVAIDIDTTYSDTLDFLLETMLVSSHIRFPTRVRAFFSFFLQKPTTELVVRDTKSTVAVR